MGQRSRLTFDILPEVTHTVFPAIYLNRFSQNPFGQLNSNLIRRAGTNFYANYFGHMTKIATSHIYGKTPIKSSFSELEGQ